ncbi:hypothetical protein HK102_006987, partial [Quaeritorhiza haematococci]
MAKSPEPKTKPRTVPPFEMGPNDEDILSPYIAVVESWTKHLWGSHAPPSLTANDHLELRLFRLFFFDVLPALRFIPNRYDGERMSKKAHYIVHSFLRLSQGWDQFADVYLKESERSFASQQPGLHRTDLVYSAGETSLTPADTQQQQQQQPSLHRDDVVPLTYTRNSTLAVAQQQGIVSARVNSNIQPHSQQQLCSPAPPTLPPELVGCILQYLDPSIGYATKRAASLTPCALVNRTWHSVALPLMWKKVRLDSTLSTFLFLRGLLSTCYVSRSNTVQNCAHVAVVDLEFPCADHKNVWRTLAQNLFLFPRLQRLTLRDLPILSELSLLFDQDLPSLEDLTVDCDNVGEESWDHECARSFFSRLASVDLHVSDPSATNFECVLDAAHGNLRQICFPQGTPDTLVRRFFGSCSNALSVVNANGFESPLSGSTLQVLANNCTGLRALQVEYDDETGLDGFKYLFELRGPQLVALRLYDSSDYGDMSPQLLRLVNKHCRSLEYLVLSIRIFFETRSSFEHEILDLLRKRGSTLRYLSLGTTAFSDMDINDTYLHITDNLLIKTIGESCPNLRRLLCVSEDIGKMTRATEAAVATMLEKCRYLHTLGLGIDLDSAHISDPLLRAKLNCLKRFDFQEEARRYFRWYTYSPQKRNPNTTSTSL